MGIGKGLTALTLGIILTINPSEADSGIYKTRHNTYDTSKPITADKCDKKIGCQEAKLIFAANGQDSSYECYPNWLEENDEPVFIPSGSPRNVAYNKFFAANSLYNWDFNNLQTDLRTYNILIGQAERKGDTAEAHALVWDAEKTILGHYFKYCFLYSDCRTIDTVIVRGR